MKLEEAKRNYK